MAEEERDRIVACDCWVFTDYLHRIGPVVPRSATPRIAALSQWPGRLAPFRTVGPRWFRILVPSLIVTSRAILWFHAPSRAISHHLAPSGAILERSRTISAVLCHS